MKQELINSILELQREVCVLIDSPEPYTREELEKDSVDVLKHIEYQLLIATLPD
tara:strand:- start:1440 stop:1601 length:162 start_codon:yes stop_codon:yes gene_type:complete